MNKTMVMTIFWLLLGTAVQSATAASTNNATGASAASSTSMPTVTGAWARATAPGQMVGAVYMTIASPVGARLQKIETSAAKMVEVHAMEHQNGIMRMRAVPSLHLAAGATVDLAPGGMHLMLMGLKQPLKAGDTLQLTMTFTTDKLAANTLVVDVPIRTTKPQ
ncbi:copper chaperone PCu(A)C [Herminiimonas aquatilis]|uniref:Copper chaperone PCu(A)C n=1 Tax=Herminiimonas aquatilis TaxID=345342 RepID=A0ABW2J7M7_9BURK